MTYHSSVSGFSGLGMSGGLGADLSNDDAIRIRFQPGRGVTATNAPDIFRMIKQRLDASRMFYGNTTIGWDVNNTFLARAKALGPSLAPRVTLRQAANKVIEIAREVSSAAGYSVYLVGIRNDDKNEYIAGPPVPAQTAPTGGNLTSSTPPQAPPSPVATPGEQSFTPPQAPASVTMTVKLLQQRLIAAGVSVPGGADGRWGNGTRTALESFATARSVALPSLGSRSDYVQSGSNITVPAALASALPAAGGGSSGGRSVPSGGGGGGGAQPGEPSPGDSEPLVPESTGGKLPWPYIGAGIGIALMAAAFMLSRRPQ